MQTSITITAADDMHAHLRDGAHLERTVSDMAEQVDRAIVMPNLVPPVTSVDAALAYRDRILQHMPTHAHFTPLMTLYLTDNMTVEMIKTAVANEHIYACKLYPAGATTNADAGVTDIKNIYPLLECMQAEQLPLLIHAEVTEPNIDIFDREKVFIERHIIPLIEKFPRLKIVIEHITTEFAANFVKQAPDNIAATITAHHLLLNRNDLLVGGIKPHYYCLPIVKSERDRVALLNAATSGSPQFFLGSDSAPHALERKESACGCAGIYTAHATLPFYAQAFASCDKLERLNDFASVHGAAFYGLPHNKNTISLHKEKWEVPARLAFGDSTLSPFFAEKIIEWKITHE